MQTVQEIAQQLNIIDDTLFQKMAEDIGFCEEVISTILQQKVIVKKVTPQDSIKNLQGRSVVLDVLCILESGQECNVEVQKADDDNHVKRVRYNTSCITANITTPGSKFEKVPKTSARKKQFKESEGGRENMCDLVEEYAKQRAEEAAKEAAKKAAEAEARKNARKFFENGATYEMVRASIDMLSDEELQSIYEKALTER